MSRWMYPSGEFTYAGSEESVDALLNQNDDLPYGSEGPLRYRYFSFEEDTCIIIDGYLRDRGWRNDIENVRQWFKRIITAPGIGRSYIEVKAGGLFCAGFYYQNGVYQEITVPDWFIDLEEDA